jgi:site-specific DNA-methyltransferase (adenine-specific)
MQEDYKTDDLWFMRGDCLERMKEIPDGSVDMILTDPPYGTTACKWDTVIDLDRMWAELKRIIKPNGAIVMTASQPFTTTLIASNMKMFKYCWVWDKGVGVNFFHVKKQPLKVTEDVCVFYMRQPTYNPSMTKREKPIKKSNNNVGESSGYSIDESCEKYVGRVYDEAYPNVILKFSTRSAGSRGLHPTQKPVELMEYMIKTYTNEGETVLDFTSGSFTTGVACVNLGRKFIGIEMDGHYYDIGTARVLKTLAEMDDKEK